MGIFYAAVRLCGSVWHIIFFYPINSVYWLFKVLFSEAQFAVHLLTRYAQHNNPCVSVAQYALHLLTRYAQHNNPCVFVAQYALHLLTGYDGHINPCPMEHMPAPAVFCGTVCMTILSLCKEHTSSGYTP